MSAARRKTLRTGMPRTLAGRVEFVAELLEGPRGANGERTAPMITRDQAREMLALPAAPTVTFTRTDEDGNAVWTEPVARPLCVVKPACGACWYCLKRKAK